MSTNMRFERRLAAVLLGIVTGSALNGCAPEPAEVEPLIRPVRYEAVVERRGGSQRTFSGTARAAVESTLSFKVAGTVTERPVEVGDTVAKGDLLARIDPQDYRVRLQEAEAGLAQARANLRNAQATYERTRGLYENRNASQSDLDAARAAAESAEATVKASTQQLEAARLQLSYTRLTAPQDCAIAETFVKANENVRAGQDVVKIACGDCSEVEVSVPETFIDRVDEVASVAVRIDALGKEEYPAEITEVGVASGGTTFPVIVRLVGECPQVRSGMAADVTFAVSEEAAYQGIVVPVVAVGEDDRGNYVYALETDADSRWFARRRAVEVGGVAAKGVQIVSGLDEGELIVTAGVRRIEDGQQVKLLTD